jgi:hypothetical protein
MVHVVASVLRNSAIHHKHLNSATLIFEGEALYWESRRSRLERKHFRRIRNVVLAFQALTYHILEGFEYCTHILHGLLQSSRAHSYSELWCRALICSRTTQLNGPAIWKGYCDRYGIRGCKAVRMCWVITGSCLQVAATALCKIMQPCMAVCSGSGTELHCDVLVIPSEPVAHEMGRALSCAVHKRTRRIYEHVQILAGNRFSANLNRSQAKQRI